MLISSSLSTALQPLGLEEDEHGVCKAPQLSRDETWIHWGATIQGQQRAAGGGQRTSEPCEDPGWDRHPMRWVHTLTL